MQLSTVDRYYHTLRQLKPWQVVGRLAAPFRSRWALFRQPEPPADLSCRWQPAAAFPLHDPWNSADALTTGRFCFLNETADLGRPIDWHAEHMPLLWRFNLHYFEYLHRLDDEQQLDFCRSWMAANPPGTSVSWHAYPTSLRIVNWCRAGVSAADVLGSLYRQAGYLHRNLETHVYGNHLLENARALVMAGAYLHGHGEASDWIERGVEIYRRESPEQILSDGFHMERSPMYHALVLEGYLDVLNVLPKGRARPEWLVDAARRMTDALASIVRPDGRLPLLNDSTHEIAAEPARMLAYAREVLDYEPSPRTTFAAAGYFIHRDSEVYLITDAGPGGPDYLMAHAHADIFSYELCIGGRPLIVDSGVYEYQPGAMRDYVRSTSAHNTVDVDGTDQLQCWSSFRVARRFAPTNVSFGTDGSSSEFSGRFDGYASLIGDDIRHTRHLAVDREDRFVRIDDTVDGRGEHCVESRVHFHPEVVVDRNALAVSRGGVQCRIRVKEGEVRWDRGWYCPRFGVRRANDVLVIGGDRRLPARLTYEIIY